MHKVLTRLLSAMVAIASLSITAHADDFTPIPVGYISYDVTGANVAQFDIVNFTGTNASTFPDTTFPITTPLTLSNLSLTVNYLGGQSIVLGPSYFTLDSDGLSLDGEQLSTLSGPPTGLFDATSAVLTGNFSTQNLTLNDGSTGRCYSASAQRSTIPPAWPMEISPSSTPFLRRSPLPGCCSEQVCS